MNKPCCQNELDAGQLAARQRQVLIQVLLINLAAFTIMLTGTLISQSSALLSGSLDNLGDALTYAVSLAVIGASSTAKAKVALFKGLLILAAAVGVALQIVWRLSDPTTPLVESMGIAAMLNLAANGLCLWRLSPYKNQDVNMSSVWECSRNDVFEGFAVLATAALVWWFNAAWPDLLVATVLLAIFLRSSVRVLRNAVQALTPQTA